MNVIPVDRFVGARAPSRMETRPGGAQHLRMLISSAGRRVGLLRAFRSSAAALGVDLEVFACDLQPDWSSACMEADYAFAVPPATSPDFVEAMLGYCERHAITLVIPTIDTELRGLRAQRESFAGAGVQVAISTPAIVALAADKAATAAALAKVGVLTPRTASFDQKPATAEAGAGSVVRPTTRA